MLCGIRGDSRRWCPLLVATSPAAMPCQPICVLQNTPIWVFHGALDDVVPAWQSGVLVDALRACPADIRLTLYVEADHDDAWKRAYDDPALYEWLLAQRLRP